jgi:hypothetical protein
MPEPLADSAAPRYARAAALAAARRVITTMHTEANFPLKRESATLAFEARNRALLPSVSEAPVLQLARPW